MYKHVALLVRKPGLSHEAFVDYWQSTHTPIAREIEGVVRYTTVLPVDPEASAFDGIAELVFAELEALHDALGGEGSRDYDPERGKAREARRDVDNFLAVERRPRLIGEERLEFDETGGETTDLYKHSAFLVRRDGLSHEEFRDRWANDHAPLARDVPGVVRHARVEPTDPVAAEFDGVAELYFEELGALRAALGGEGAGDHDPDDQAARAARERLEELVAVEDTPRFVGRETVQKDATGGRP